MIPDGFYTQDIIAPKWVAHGLDYGDLEPGTTDRFGHIYNFIDYGFAEGEAEYRARHYLDEPGSALLLHAPTDDAFAIKVLVFLAMRFDRLLWLDGDLGYVPVPDSVMELVNTRVKAHMAAYSA